jgi:tetratricopeptide (TPR) repeat protein
MCGGDQAPPGLLPGGDHPQPGAALHIQIDNCFLEQSELEEALGQHKQAEAVAKQTGDGQGLAAALGNMGNVCHDKGELDEALSYLERALQIDREMGSRLGEANQLNNMGIVCWLRGEPDRAAELLNEALAIFEQMGARLDVERTKRNIERVTGGGE